MDQLIEIYENFDRKINVKCEYRTLMQGAQSFIEFYSNFIRLDDALAFDDDIFLKKLFDKLIKRLKDSYDTREGFIILKDAKEYLFKLNNNQRANYQLRIFKTVFIRTITGLTRKSPTTITTTSTTRIIPVIETIYTSTVKSKQKINTKVNTKELMCYTCDKIDHYRKDCIIQNQTDVGKKVLKEARLYHLNINEK